MDSRIVQFIAALRASGVRVSLAESQDALFATGTIGVQDRNQFKVALKTTLVKDHADEPTFEQLFPLFFGSGGSPMIPPSSMLSPEEEALLRQALQALAGQLNELLQRLMEGRDFSPEELAEMARRAGANSADDMRYQDWITRRMLRQMGLEDLIEKIEQLLQQLAQMGIPQEMRDRLEALMLANAQALTEQAQQMVGQTLAERLTEAQRNEPDTGDLLDQPFNSLTEKELFQLRKEVIRLAARLRTRAALRRKRGKGPILDAKATLRRNIHHGGVPFELIHKRRRKKARFTIIVDVSTSMRPTVDFLLLLMYMIQDQVGRTRSFAFIDHIEEVSAVFQQYRPEEAVPIVLRQLPAGHYNTDLGASLAQFEKEFLDAVDHRTTLIFCGDGRNNYNNPRIDIVDHLQRRSRRVVWFTPEPEYQWGSGDSDIYAYASVVSQIFKVGTLRQLTEAIDALL